MKTSDVTFTDLSRSVLAVPPLARHADLSLNQAANRQLIDHLEAGGVMTLLYGGNANFYNLPLSEYTETLGYLAEAAGDDTWVIPSAGPDYGRMQDQAKLLRGGPFPTVMVLPLQFPTTTVGVETGLRKFVEVYGRPIIIYIKRESYITPQSIRRLVDDGLICGIKYAVVRPDPADDDYLRTIIDLIDPRHVISGMGERPVVVHLRDFGLSSFTSGSVCIAPRASTALLEALKLKNYERAETLRTAFLPLEDCRDALSPIRVLHESVTLAGIADMGPILPLLHNLEADYHTEVTAATKKLLAYDESLKHASA